MNRISWSALPQDLIVSIAERLETTMELVSFRAVCPNWRNAIPKSLFASKTILSPLFPYRGTGHSSIVVASSVYLMRSAVDPKLPPWLITVEEFNPGKLYVRSPLSRVVDKNFPAGFQPTLFMSDYHWQELGRFYGLRSYDKPEEMFTERRLSRYDNKVVLYVDPDRAGSLPTIDDCSIVELYDRVDYLTLTRLKNGKKHQVYSNFRRREFDDIVNFKGRIYTVDYQGSVCILDYHSLSTASFIEEPLPDVSRSNYKKRLAVSCGELYLVYRRCQKSDNNSAFKVFKLNEKKRKWDEVEGIGDDKIIFVTFDGCFFASIKDFPGWKGNCIVFRRGSFPEYSDLKEFDNKIFEKWGVGIGFGHGSNNINLDVAVFHFDNGDCVPVDTYPRYCEVIWPPPSWLWKGESKS